MLMLCKFIGGPKEFIHRTMDVDTTVETYTLHHRSLRYDYHKTRYIEDGKEVIAYLCTAEEPKIS